MKNKNKKYYYSSDSDDYIREKKYYKYKENYRDTEKRRSKNSRDYYVNNRRSRDYNYNCSYKEDKYYKNDRYKDRNYKYNRDYNDKEKYDNRHYTSRKSSRSNSKGYLKDRNSYKRKYNYNYSSNSIDSHKSYRKRSRSYEKTLNKDKKKTYRFDSPPPEMKDDIEEKELNFNKIENLDEVKKLMPCMKKNTPQEIIDKLENIKKAKKNYYNRDEKKIFIGNLPNEVSSTELLNFINKKMESLNLKDDNLSNCAIDVWIEAANIYAYVEFRSIDESEKALNNLQNIKFKDKNLRISKLQSLIFQNWEEHVDDNFESENEKDILDFDKNTEIFDRKFTIQPPTNILILKNIIKIEELYIDEEFNHIKFDTQNYAKTLGNLLSIKIPRPNFKDLNQAVPGLTNIYLEFKNVHEAKYCRSLLIKKLFRGRIVDISYHDLLKYKNNDFSIKIYN